MPPVIKLLRPQQWLKNLFVFMPLFFSGNMLHIVPALASVIAFLSFSAAASAIYALNDLIDVEADRLHPTKRFRPIAAGLISPVTAIATLVILAAVAIALPMMLPQPAALYTIIIIGAYLILNIAYTLWLKQFALIDIFIIALGFVLRVAAGGAAALIPVSHWIIIMTFLLALFLALCKRRDDISLYRNEGKKMRRNIDKYNLSYINQAITMVATIMLVSYIMYTLSPEVEARFGTNLVYVTSIFVLAGLLRYMQLATVYDRTGSPTRILLHDRFIQITVLAWLLTFAAIIYC
ncbi:MAG: decaprenyl-phosphate phosphoribosyltransferase [Muribaculaceae bacterium]|nr:decaprenyl-phosphate phosphoribosyltransferase [Muribaculaceae bacterium]